MTTPRIVTTPGELRAALANDAPGLVPTMGALHEGHRSLIERSAAENARTVVSIFVNPTQFSSHQDLASYPRELDEDVAFAGSAGADLIYAPEAQTVYPAGFQTGIDPGSLAGRWEGEFRPGHFRGVATVVAILLNTVRPRRAYFGEKDYQQLCVVRQMSRDLLLPGEIVGCPTIRAADGLALSSRNSRLNAEERRLAVAIPEALFAVRRRAQSDGSLPAQLIAFGKSLLERTPVIAVEYLAIVHPGSLEPLTDLVPGARVIIAVTLGGVRLIDNLQIVD